MRTKLKLSEQAVKTTIPGVLQVRRFGSEKGLVGDMIYDQTHGIDQRNVIVDVRDSNRRKCIPVGAKGNDLLVPVMRAGKVVEQGTADQIFHEPKAPYTKALLAAAFELEAAEGAVASGAVSV